MQTNEWVPLLTILAYMALIVAVGIRYSRRAGRGAESFFLGGRSLGPLVTAMSAEASDMSGWLLMGMPGLALLMGTAEAFWTALGLALGTYLNWLFIARRLRRYTVLTGAITIPGFFSRRFRDERRILSTLAAAIILVFFVPYTASGFVTCGKLFSSLFGMEYTRAMLLSAAIIVAYTALGGFLAASVTDYLQSILMTVALLAVIGFGLVYAGGLGAVVENARSIPQYFSLTAVAGQGAGSFGFLPILSTMAWGLGYFGVPHVLLRFMAIRREEELNAARRIGSVWVVVSMAAAIVIGVVGRALMDGGLVGPYGSIADSETIIVAVARIISASGPALAALAGLILAGILAATMSTADSQLLTAASSVSEDLFKGLFRRQLGERQSLWVARATVVAVSLVAAVLAYDPNSSVFQIVSFAWAGFGAAFGPLMLFCLFWKRTTLSGAVAGMITGGATIFLWKFLVRPHVPFLDFYELLPAFLASALAIYTVSLLSFAPDEAVQAEFDRVSGKTEKKGQPRPF